MAVLADMFELSGSLVSDGVVVDKAWTSIHNADLLAVSFDDPSVSHLASAAQQLTVEAPQLLSIWNFSVRLLVCNPAIVSAAYCVHSPSSKGHKRSIEFSRSPGVHPFSWSAGVEFQYGSTAIRL